MIADGAPAPALAQAGADEAKIARRLVLFVHGFDPRGVKLPYSNFLREFEKHKRLTGAEGRCRRSSRRRPTSPG